MAVSAGRRLGPYEIVSPIGAGGMGEVYKARDARLNRFVAIKVLPEDVSADPDRLRRFEREARAASALNHPNIVTVHDVGVSGSTSYLAMELVEGKTLRDLLLPGPLPIKKLLDIAAQIADGLAAAHEAGIVHRDLKPRNVIVTREGHVKIVDFGLAKQPVSSDADLGKSGASTLSERGTLSGEVVGTVEYMSPEQARGKPIDYRSDQFSFGTVLYEMATGTHAFARNTAADTLVAVLQQEPSPIAQLRPEVPPPLRWVVERCLAKSASDRYRSTRDLASELQSLKDHISEVTIAQPEPAKAPVAGVRFRLLVAGLAVVAAAGFWLLLSATLRQRPIQPEFRRLTFRNGVVSRALFVPNSNSILYTATWDDQPPGSFLALPDSPGLDRRLESELQLPMAYTEDGSQVLVLLGSSRPTIDVRGTLAWWPAPGGKARPILEDGGWADWARKGHFFAVVHHTGAERVLEIRTEAGLVRPLFRTRGAISYVRVSPDEKNVAFIHHPSRFDDAGELRVASTAGSGSRSLTQSFERCLGLDWNQKTGEVWFTASYRNPYSSTVWAVDLSGRVRSLYSLPDLFVLHNVALAGNRCLLILSENRISLTVRRSNEAPKDMSWLGMTMIADISPDSRSILFFDGGTTATTSGIWIRPVDGGDAVPWGSGEPGAFSPDGRSVVALTRALAGPAELEIVPIGPGATRQLTFSKANHWSPSFAGRSTLLFVSSEGGSSQIWRIETNGTGTRPLGAKGCDLPKASPALTEFLCICGEERNALFVYPLNKGKVRELYRAAGNARFHYARWSDSGGQVFAVTRERKLLTIDSSTGALLKEEILPLPPSGVYGTFYRAAINGDGTVQAYSVARSSSGLYDCTGLQ